MLQYTQFTEKYLDKMAHNNSCNKIIKKHVVVNVVECLWQVDKSVFYKHVDSYSTVSPDQIISFTLRMQSFIIGRVSLLWWLPWWPHSHIQGRVVITILWLNQQCLLGRVLRLNTRIVSHKLGPLGCTHWMHLYML